jgi:hypothetical protein
MRPTYAIPDGGLCALHPAQSHICQASHPAPCLGPPPPDEAGAAESWDASVGSVCSAASSMEAAARQPGRSASQHPPSRDPETSPTTDLLMRKPKAPPQRGQRPAGAPACHNPFGRDTPAASAIFVGARVRAASRSPAPNDPAGRPRSRAVRHKPVDENTRLACSHLRSRPSVGSSDAGALLVGCYCCAVLSCLDEVNTAMQPWVSLPPAEEQTVLCAAGMGT